MTVPAVQSVILSCTHVAEGEQVPQQEEIVYVGKPGDGPGYLAPSTTSTGELVVSSSSSSVTTIARNLVGLPPPRTDKVEEQPNNVSVDDDSEEKKKQAMDQLRKVSAYLYTIACMLPYVELCDNVYMYAHNVSVVNIIKLCNFSTKIRDNVGKHSQSCEYY